MFGFLYWRFGKPHAPGQIIGLYLVISSVLRFLIEFTRNHEQALPFGLPFSITQWIAIVLAAAGAVLLVRLAPARRAEPAAARLTNSTDSADLCGRDACAWTVSSAQRGFVLIAMSVAMLLMLAVMGLAFDFGRIYIARNEAQVFTDAAAMAAASKLDGTDAGLDRARQAVARLPMRWNLGTEVVHRRGGGVQPGRKPGVWASRHRCPTIKSRSRFCAPWAARSRSPFPRIASLRAKPVRLIE